MTLYEYCIARVAAQIRQQPEAMTRENYALLRVVSRCVERYRKEGK